MSTDDPLTQTKPFPEAFSEARQYADEYTKSLIGYLEAHPHYAERQGFWWDDFPTIRSRELDDSLNNTPEASIDSREEAALLYAYIRGMNTVLARLDEQIPTNAFEEGDQDTD